MSRIEKGADANGQLEAMRGEMMKTVRRSGRRGAAGCAVAVLISLCVMFALSAWLVSATGLVIVPGFSRAYRPSAPDHAVEPGEAIEALVNRALGEQLTARLREGSGSLQDRRISLVIPEGSFTASLRQALESTDQAVFDPSSAQAAVALDALELFLPFKDNPQGSALRALVSFSAKDGRLVPSVSGVRLGSLPVPDALTQAALEPAVRESLAPFARELGRYAAVRAASFLPGALRLEAELTVEVLQAR